jgi:hypothetical protein
MDSDKKRPRERVVGGSVPTREAFGVFSALLALVEGRHAALAVCETFRDCHNAREAASQFISLPDVQFAGMAFYSAAFAAAVAGLIWGLLPIADRVRRWFSRRSINRS